MAEGRLLERETQEFLERYQAAPENIRDAIRDEVELVEKETLGAAARNPVPSQSLIEATQALYRDNLPSPG